MNVNLIQLPEPPPATPEQVAVALVHVLNQQLRHGNPDNYGPIVTAAVTATLAWFTKLGNQGAFAEPTPAAIADYLDQALKALVASFAQANGEEPPLWSTRPLSDQAHPEEH